MRIPSLIAFIGFVLLIVGTWCPLVRPFGLMNMDVYDLNRPYGFVLMLTGVVGIVGVGLSKVKLVRLTAWLALILVILLFVAAYLKINGSFNFIPIKSFAGFLARQIKFKWGWYVLYSGAGIALIGALIKRSRYTITS